MALRELRRAVAELADQTGAPTPYETTQARWRDSVDAWARNVRQVPRGR